MTTEIVLLVMFVTRLNVVKKEMMVQFVMRRATARSVEISAASGTATNTSDINMDNDQEAHSPEKDKITNLHNLMKKQTILVGIAITSTGCIWIGSFMYGDLAFLSSWDNCINAVCVWLMFDASNRYWELCKTKGICKCCYKIST